MALTSQDAWAMAAAARRADRVLMVGYPSRLSGLWRTVKDRLESGALGQLRQISAAISTYRRWFWEMDSLPADVQAIVGSVAGAAGVPERFFAGWGHPWHPDPTQMGGGAFVDLGTHFVDLLFWLGGAPPVEVAALTATAGLPVESFVTAQARLTNGVLLALSWGDAPPRPLLEEERQLMILGEEGALTSGADDTLWLYQAGTRTKIESEHPDRSKADAFVATILDGSPNPSPAEQGANAVAFMEAVYRSAAEGRLVRVAELPH
jgi:predicted dehydrogenase